MRTEFRRVKEIFLTALEKEDPAQRADYLNDACGHDEAVRRHVEVLLRKHEQAGSFLAPPAADPGSTGEVDASNGGTLAEGPGTRIGPYKLLQKIGEGGMGVVYMAEQQEPVRRKVAFKIIKPGMDSAPVIARFEAERQALAMMDHQNIAKVFDAGTTPGIRDQEPRDRGQEPDVRDQGSEGRLLTPDSCLLTPGSGRPYFVMELVHGVPITQFCDANKLTPRERLQLFVPVCQALQHAHQKGIIHRDVKPSNVLVTLYDDKPVPKVIDFGVAKAIEQRLTEKTLFTQFGVLVGTFEYMSPEQAEMNALGVDTRSDIYSLGVLLYELLTGTTPLERERLRTAALSELVRLIKEEEPPRPSVRLSSSNTLPKIAAARKTEPAKLTKLVRGEIDWIVMKCLEKDRSRRYETANGLARDVERYLHDEPVEACPPSAGYRLRKFMRKYRRPLTVASLLLMVATVGSAIGTLLLAQERDVAKSNYQRAEQNLETAYRILDKIYLAWAEKRLPQAKEVTPEDRQFLEDALGFYLQFANQKSNEPSGRHKTAVASLRVANIQSQLGQLEEATRNYRQALAVFDSLAGEFPDVPSYRQYLARCHSDMADEAEKGGELNSAQEYEEHQWQAIALLERLAAEDPAQADYQRDLAEGYLRLALHRLAAVPEGAGPHEAYRLDEHGRTIRAKLAIQQPEAALASYDQAIRTLKHWLARMPRSDHVRNFYHYAQDGRAGTLFELGRLREVEQTYQEFIELDPHWYRFCAAPLRLHRGDVDGYRRICREMLAVARGTHNPWFADQNARTCLLAPDAVSDLGPVLRLAERAVTGSEGASTYPWFLLTRGMAAYRAGQFTNAIERMNKVLSLGGEVWYDNSPLIAGTARLFLAMAHYQLGEVPRARQVLDQATQLVEQKYPEIGGYRSLGPEWHDWLRFQLVRREAERLLKEKTEAAGEALRPNKVVAELAASSATTSSGRLVCAPGPMTLVFYGGPAPQQSRAQAMFLYTPNQAGGGPIGITLAALALLALEKPHTLSGFQAPLAFDAGSNPVSVAVGDFNRDGIADLVVANHASNNVSVLLGKGDGTFRAAVNYATGSGPNAVAVADMNGDGIPDLVVVNSRSVSMLLGNGDGTFQAAVDYAVGGALHAVAVADFNGDGKVDLAVANSSKAGVSVLLGNGDGTFGAAVTYPAGAAPSSLAVGDFNRDGIPDLVVTNNLTGDSVSVLLGKGDGTFRAAVKYAAGSGSSNVAVADLNGDGILDLAVANAGSNTISVLLGNGDGTFRAAVNYSAGGGDRPAPRSVAVGDFNGDGKPDLAVVSDTVSVRLGKGDGTFQAAVNYAAGLTPNAVAVGDFNGDGKPDLAVAIVGGNNVGVLLGQGDGTFQAAPTYRAGISALELAVGDFNGDGIADLAVVNAGGPVPPGGSVRQGTVSILLGKGDGTFRGAVDYAVALAPFCMALGDFNGDGILDLVISNSGSSDVSVLLGNGDGTFRAAVNYPTGPMPGGVLVGDFNGDGIPDLATANLGKSGSGSEPGSVSILLGKGDGTFQAAVDYASGGNGGASLAVGDFNGDGIPDLVIANQGTNQTGQGGNVSILMGKGNGTFEAPVTYTAGSGALSLTVADFNGDGILDFAVGYFLSSYVSVLLGKGDGTFHAAVNYAVGPHGGGPPGVVASDFSGDGILDLAVTFGGGVRVLLGNGDGTFQTTPISYVAGGAYNFFVPALAVGDFNGDGLPDLAVGNVDSRNVSILINTGKWAPLQRLGGERTR
jgi:serine/threonine protein kinase